MLIHSAIKAVFWLALGFGLVACAAATEPQVPTLGLDESSDVTPIFSPELAGATGTANEEKPELSIAPTALKIQTALPPAMTPIPVVSLPDLGPAPDFSNDVWLNSERPLDLALLQGKVILVEFWTFG